jgi:hypothetical protein
MIFVSYSHRDEKWRQGFEIISKPLSRSESIGFWSDKNLQAGEWEPQLESAIDKVQQNRFEFEWPPLPTARPYFCFPNRRSNSSQSRLSCSANSRYAFTVRPFSNPPIGRGASSVCRVLLDMLCAPLSASPFPPAPLGFVAAVAQCHRRTRHRSVVFSTRPSKSNRHTPDASHSGVEVSHFIWPGDFAPKCSNFSKNHLQLLLTSQKIFLHSRISLLMKTAEGGDRPAQRRPVCRCAI